jgi:hypothetical protein
MRKIRRYFCTVLSVILPITVVLALSSVPAYAASPGTTGVFNFEWNGATFNATVNTVGWRLQNIQLVWALWYAATWSSTPIDELSASLTCSGSTSCQKQVQIADDPACGIYVLKAFAAGSLDGLSNLAEEGVELTTSNSDCGPPVCDGEAACASIEPPPTSFSQSSVDLASKGGG